MKSNSTTEIIRYVVLFIAVGLLAPYAGCHIFTSSPRAKVEGPATAAIESLERNKQNVERRRSLVVDGGGGTNEAPTQLDELQELLSE